MGITFTLPLSGSSTLTVYRIEPEEGRFDPAALDHYKEMSELLKRNGIATYVTLNHFTVPQWFAARGGFQERENIPYFQR